MAKLDPNVISRKCASGKKAFAKSGLKRTPTKNEDKALQDPNIDDEIDAFMSKCSGYQVRSRSIKHTKITEKNTIATIKPRRIMIPNIFIL